MAHGDGSIQQFKRDGKPVKNCWRVSISLGNDGKGKRKRKTKVVHGTKADARKVRDEMLRDSQIGLDIIAADRITFKELSDMWLNVATRGVGERTRKRYIARANLLCRHAGTWKVKQVTTQDCYALMDWLVEEREADGYPIAERTQVSYLKILRRIFEHGIENGFIYRNPAKGVKPPKLPDVDRRALTEEEATALLEQLDSEVEEVKARMRGNGSMRTVTQASRLLCVRMILMTGMRLGEACGLPWRCVDFEEGTVRVEQTLASDNTLHPPKTKAGLRTIALDMQSMEVLREWRELQESRLSTIGVRVDGDSPVYPSMKGYWVFTSNLSRWWSEWRETHGLPGIVLHEMRNTQITHLLGNGVDIKTTQTRVGHSDVYTTLNTYARALPDKSRAAGDLVAELFGGKSRKVVAFKSA